LVNRPTIQNGPIRQPLTGKPGRFVNHQKKIFGSLGR
jgi:hypothetical protein